MTNAFALHLADSLLRSLGGASVALRLPAPVSGGTATELGLTALSFSDATISPAVIRSLPSSGQGAERYEILLSASALQKLAETQNAASVNGLLASAAGLVYNGKLLLIYEVTADAFAGAPYLYRLHVSVNSALRTAV